MVSLPPPVNAMRLFWIAATIVLLVVLAGAIWLYAELHAVQSKYEREFDERRQAFRALDAKFPYAAPAAIPPDRFDAYLRVREKAASTFRERSRAPSEGLGHPLDTKIAMLRALAEAMEAERMGLREYATLSRRMQAVVARGRDASAPEPLRRLYAAWRRELATRRHPEGPPLPEPDRNAPQSDVELVIARADAIEASMDADLLAPLVEEIGT
jgi:hypothetical protein